MGIQNGVIGFGVMMSALALVSGDKLVQPLVVKGPPALKMHGNVNTPRSAKSKKEVTILLGPQQAENIEQQMSFEQTDLGFQPPLCLEMSHH